MDYSKADNEGHIYVSIVNQGIEPVTLEKGKAFCQGIIMKYCTIADDNANGKRKGGLGSSDENK